MYQTGQLFQWSRRLWVAAARQEMVVQFHHWMISFCAFQSLSVRVSFCRASLFEASMSTVDEYTQAGGGALPCKLPSGFAPDSCKWMAPAIAEDGCSIPLLDNSFLFFMANSFSNSFLPGFLRWTYVQCKCLAIMWELCYISQDLAISSSPSGLMVECAMSTNPLYGL